MTRNDDFIGQLEDYLDEYQGSTPLPGDVRNAIRAKLPSTNQRPAWWPARRFPEMNSTAKLALAAAAVVVAAFLGVRFLLPADVGIGGPDPTPTPSPTPSALSGTDLEPGTYRLTVQGVNATLTVPGGWANLGGTGVTKESDESAFTAVVFWCCDADFASVYLDPCQWQGGVVDPPVGPTVDDLATALDNQAQRGESTPVDVTIDGYSGKMIELTVPAAIDFADCDAGEFRSWEGRFHQGPGQVDQLYILDVDGQRLVIDSTFLPGTSEADRAERAAIFESIQIDVP
jgi:hypothetical protein